MDKERVKQLNIATFNKWAPDYDKAFLAKHPQKLNDVVLDMLRGREFASLLDVGCGTGHFLSLLLNKPHGSGREAHGLGLAGIDISPGMLDIARQRLGDSVDLREGDIALLPWPDDTFDVVTSTDAVHHFPDPNPALAEIKRVIKPGGILIIADMWLPAPFRQLFNLILPFTREGDVRIYSRRQMLSFMTMNEYKDISWKRFELLGQTTTGLK